MVDPQTQQAIDTVKMLWIALGVLLASNAGTFIKLFLDRKEKAELKAEAELMKKENEKESILKKLADDVKKNTDTINELRIDLQRYFAALKIVAGPKWAKASKIVQAENPRN